MSVRVGILNVIFFCCLSWSVNASTEANTLTIIVDGIEYTADLQQSQFAKNITVNSNALENVDEYNLKIFQGTIADVPGSWISASNQAGEWRGLVSIYNKLYDFNKAAYTDRALSIVDSHNDSTMQATEIDMNSSEIDMANMCAIQHAEPEEDQTALASILPGSTNDSSSTQNTVAFAVGGINQAVNVVLALDQFHTAQYGADSVSRAIRILNNVDAIYRNSLGIALNNTAIVSYNNANPIFGNETDANVLLNQLRLSQANVFGNSQRTIASVLTFRDLQVAGNNGVAGIAYTSATCSSFAVSFNEDRTVSNESISTIVLAHEMAHNFGANHDGPVPNPANTTCPAGQNIMSPVVGNGLTSFSNCSRTEINAHIASGTCYKYPIDIALSRFGDAPQNNLAQQQVITRQIAVNNNGTVAVNNVVIEGEIDNAEIAKFVDVTANGQACAVPNTGQSYQCTIAAVAANSQQVITENIQSESLGTFIVSSEFDSSDVSQRIDILPANQSISDSHTVNRAVTPPQAPSSLSASAQTSGDIALTWNDNSNNEQSFIVQRASNGSAFATVANVPANRTGFSDSRTNLQVGTAYTYRVSAMNSLGQNFSNTSTATALEVTASASPENEISSSDDSGGGGAIYILGLILLVSRSFKKNRQLIQLFTIK